MLDAKQEGKPADQKKGLIRAYGTAQDHRFVVLFDWVAPRTPSLRSWPTWCVVLWFHISFGGGWVHTRSTHPYYSKRSAVQIPDPEGLFHERFHSLFPLGV